jgi:ubiquinone biosynthesis protein
MHELGADLLTEPLLRSIGMDQLVPAALDRWRPLIIDGVLFLLRRLARPRQAAIVQAQLQLPAGATPAQRAVALLQQCPTQHKLGQVVARHRGIPAHVRRELHVLESPPSTTPTAELLALVRRELPPDAPVTIADQALAEGSVAVVIPFTWLERGQTQHGVFKILKPGVEQRLHEELEVWLEVADFLQQRARELALPALDYRDTLESIRELLTNEVRLAVEQTNLAAAARMVASDARIRVPRLLPWCTERMTAMERVFGTTVVDPRLPPGVREHLAESMVAGLVAGPFWSRDAEALIHADPHAGNLLATDDGRLAVLDWSLTARLSKAQREALVDAAAGGFTLDAARICRAVAALGSLAPGHPVLRAAVERALQRVRQLTPPGFDWLVALLDEVASSTEAGFRRDLILFRKAWLTLRGVIDDVADGCPTDRMLLGAGLQHLITEFPSRMLAPFDSRRFDSHLSSADLVGLWMSAAWLPARFWLGAGGDAGRPDSIMSGNTGQARP